MLENKPNLIVDLTFTFSLKVIEFVELLEKQKKYILANQLLRSGTSIGANVREAQGAESRNDFIHKLKIASKEAQETEYWLLLCLHSNYYPDSKELLLKIGEVNRVLSKIISSTKSGSSQH